MKYTADLITECREDTGNQSFSSTTGISDAKFVRALNYGLENAQGIISRTCPKLFQSQKVINVVANQEAYTIPDRLYLGTRIVNVEYSPTGQASDYFKIFEQALIRRDSWARDAAVCYIRRNGEILLQPLPASAITSGLRVIYERQVDTLALRAGIITGFSKSATNLTSLTLNTASDDATNLQVAQYICVNDKYGNVKMYNVPISAYNPGTGVITIQGGTFAFQPGEDATIDDYVTIGQYTTTHGKLADPVERYVKSYANWEILSKDTASATKAGYFEKQLITIKGEIIESYQEADRDDDEIQIVNWDLIVP